MKSLLLNYYANFITPEVHVSSDDITTTSYEDASNQVCDDELGIGTATRLFLVEREDDVVGTQLEICVFENFMKKL